MQENFFACIVFCPEKINFHKAKKTKQNFYAIFCFLLAMMHKEKRKSLVLGPKKVIFFCVFNFHEFFNLNSRFFFILRRSYIFCEQAEFAEFSPGPAKRRGRRGSPRHWTPSGTQ
jgi:hypothetical protein